MKTPFRSIRTVIEDFKTRSGETRRLGTDDLLKFANGALNILCSDQQDQQKIALIPVKEYSAIVPKDFRKVSMMLGVDETLKHYVDRIEITKWVQEVYGSDGCEIEYELKCPKCGVKDCSCRGMEVTINVDKMWRDAHPQYQVGSNQFLRNYGGLYNDNPNRQVPCGFQIMRHKNAAFHGADFHLKGCMNIDPKLNAATPLEYIVEPTYIRTNFREGFLLLSYTGYRTDSDGYRMVPDLEQVYEAMFWYMEARILYRTYKDTGDPKYMNLYQLADSKERMEISKAKSLLQNPDFDEFWSFIMNHLHKNVGYKNWEDKLNSTQSDRYNPPQ